MRYLWPAAAAAASSLGGVVARQLIPHCDDITSHTVDLLIARQ